MIPPPQPSRSSDKPSTNRHDRLWEMTAEERVAAFYRSELSFADCQAWSRRFPQEPPTGPSGEYLYILARTPEWLGET